MRRRSHGSRTTKLQLPLCWLSQERRCISFIDGDGRMQGREERRSYLMAQRRRLSCLLVLPSMTRSHVLWLSIWKDVAMLSTLQSPRQKKTLSFSKKQSLIYGLFGSTSHQQCPTLTTILTLISNLSASCYQNPASRYLHHHHEHR